MTRTRITHHQKPENTLVPGTFQHLDSECGIESYDRTLDHSLVAELTGYAVAAGGAFDLMPERELAF